MEETLREVLLKLIGNKLHDRVIVIENLPSKFLFEQTRKMKQRVDRDGWSDGTMVVDPSGEMIWTLRPGIEKSQTGDGGFVFNDAERESSDRMKDILRYIEMSHSRDARIPQFVDNAQMVGDARSMPLPYAQIPHIVLPAPMIPSVPILIVPPTTTTAGNQTVTVTLPAPAPAISSEQNGTPQAPAGDSKEKGKRGMSADHRAAAAARMKKMHEDRRKAKEMAAA